MKSLFQVNFNDQFWCGLLIGAILSGLLVAGLSFQRIKAHIEFEDNLSKSFFAAMEDVKNLQEKCGETCESIVLTYPETTNY